MEIYFKKLTEDLLEVCRMLDDKPEIKNKLSEITADVSFLPDVGYAFGKWTTDPPTEAGWYWVMIENRGREIHHFNGKPPYNNTYVLEFDSGPGYPLVFTHWLGPIPQPEPPK